MLFLLLDLISHSPHPLVLSRQPAAEMTDVVSAEAFISDGQYLTNLVVVKLLLQRILGRKLL